jgi:hypothetical protein
LTALLVKDQETVEISPLGNGVHAIRVILPKLTGRDEDDVERLGQPGVENHSDLDREVVEPSVNENVSGNVASHVSQLGDEGPDCSSPGPPFEIEIALGITERAAREADNISRNLIRRAQLHELATNLTFHKSQILGKLKIVAFANVSLEEDPGDPHFSKEMRALAAEDESLRPLFEKKLATGADIIVLVVHKASEVHCGRAPRIFASQREAYVAVNWKCLDERWSFVHEIGHLAGAWHNPEVVSTPGGKKPPFAHGYCSSAGRFATIMANSESCGQGSKKDWYWSNPDVSNEAGYPVGTASLHNNACLWRLRGPVLAAFGDGTPRKQ